MPLTSLANRPQADSQGQTTQGAQYLPVQRGTFHQSIHSVISKPEGGIVRVVETSGYPRLKAPST